MPKYLSIVYDEFINQHMNSNSYFCLKGTHAQTTFEEKISPLIKLQLQITSITFFINLQYIHQIATIRGGEL